MVFTKAFPLNLREKGLLNTLMNEFKMSNRDCKKFVGSFVKTKLVQKEDNN